MKTKKITDKDLLEVYSLWKKLNTLIKKKYSRGINLPEYISETLCCLVNDYILHAAEGGSEDAVDKYGNKVQIKATSNYDRDLSSFGPKSEFNILEFVRLDQTEDVFYLYRINIDILKNIYVNENETFIDKQNTGQRPRFSIIKQIIEPKQLKPYAAVLMQIGVIQIY